ncbi:hypothetical protein QG516_21020 [Pedobacter gandavensis]|uniref:hypothetical protein n=1 Tax=Pedobacter gandavensis TaxID=2679963 RepID=UPI00247AD163|nr:hypothetical protein [Pedobacter gandavensis]WGQ08998.1 hypothetical protein QG516_21020 [Pedobacter gandavensis]
MNNYKISKKDVQEKIEENYKELEEKKRLLMLNLIAEILTKATLKQLYETSN